jgi:hypothetical protein
VVGDGYALLKLRAFLHCKAPQGAWYRHELIGVRRYLASAKSFEDGSLQWGHNKEISTLIATGGGRQKKGIPWLSFFISLSIAILLRI